MAMLGYLTVPLGGGRVAPVNLLSENDFIARVDSHFEKDLTGKDPVYRCNEANCGKQFSGSSRPRRVAHLLRKSIPVDGGGTPYNADACSSFSERINQLFSGNLEIYSIILRHRPSPSTYHIPLTY